MPSNERNGGQLGHVFYVPMVPEGAPWCWKVNSTAFMAEVTSESLWLKRRMTADALRPEHCQYHGQYPAECNLPCPTLTPWRKG